MQIQTLWSVFPFRQMIYTGCSFHLDITHLPLVIMSSSMTEQTGWFDGERWHYRTVEPVTRCAPPLATSTSAPQLSSSYIISRLWCYIKDVWLSCCLTQRGPPVFCVRTRLSCWAMERTKRRQTHTHAIVWIRSSSLRAEICYLTDGCGRLSLRLNAPERDSESCLVGQR